MSIESYRDLEVWQLARKLVLEVYHLTSPFPDTERFGLTSQMRRAAVSIPSNVAEGWGRHYTAEFIQFLRKANGSLVELETQLILSADLGFCPQEAANLLLCKTKLLGQKILNLERSLQRRQKAAE